MDALTEVLSAKNPNDLFGGLAGDALKRKYRKLARQTHPDRFEDAFKTKASDAFNHLQSLWDELNGKPARSTSSAYTLSSKKHTYVFSDPLFDDARSKYFEAEYQVDDTVEKVWVRFGKEPKYNADLDQHAKALKLLNEKVPEEHRIWHPELVDAFTHRESTTNVERRVSVIKALDGYKSLLEINHIRYTADMPITAKDMAWIFRRLLVALGTAHDAGISSGGVSLEDIYIRPEDHMLTLLDWAKSATLTEESRVDDIQWAARCMEISMASYSEPPAIKRFLKGCQLASLPSAGTLLREFDELLENLYGARKFHVFEMPDN